MSDKKKGLLNENTIRRFMKLTEIDSLSDGFVSGLVQEAAEEVEEGMGMKAYARHDDDEKKDLEEDAVEEAHCGTRDDGDLEEMAHEAGARHEDEVDEAEMDMEPAAEAPAAAGDAEAIFTSLVDKIIALAADHGVEMSRDGGEAEEAAPEMDMDMEPAADDLDVADEPMEEGAHEEDELDEGAHEEDELDEGVDEDALVAEITRRVSARLQKESRNERLADELTEKIIARLKEAAQK